MPLGVDQTERDAPGAADHDPSVDPEVLAQPLDVLDQVWRRVRRQVSAWGTGQRVAAAAPPLIEQHRTVCARVEVTTRPRTAPASWTAV